MQIMQIIQLLSATTSFIKNIVDRLEEVSGLIERVQLEERNISSDETEKLNLDLSNAIKRLENAVNKTKEV